MEVLFKVVVNTTVDDVEVPTMFGFTKIELMLVCE